VKKGKEERRNKIEKVKIENKRKNGIKKKKEEKSKRR
jgi:hypothetical protein